MTDHAVLTLDVLEQAVTNAAGIRAVTDLQPAGGAGDKVFPPTYATRDHTLKYAVEERRVDGKTVPTVLLDSVASQANRIEEALYEAWEAEELDFPVISVEFGDQEGLEDLECVTTLHAPHRIADALLRDSVTDDGTLFRDTAVGQAFTDSSPRNATAVYEFCPTALFLGVWDSTGPRGGGGTKFQRALVSEIVGIGAQEGRKTASRLDPAEIQANVDVYHRADDPSDWTINEDEALLKSKKPVLFARSGGEGKGKPSAINHGNIAPSIDVFAGGVTIDLARQTTVLSLAALRRLRFQVDCKGNRLEGAARRPAEQAARTAIAALALAGVAYAREAGYDLRSRCLLVPDPGGSLILEILPADGTEAQRFVLPTDAARKLIADAAKAAAKHGFSWERQPLQLFPAPKLADLIRKSRAVAAEKDAGQDD